MHLISTIHNFYNLYVTENFISAHGGTRTHKTFPPSPSRDDMTTSFITCANKVLELLDGLEPSSVDYETTASPSTL